MLKIQNVTKKFNKNKVLNDISLNLNVGTTYGLLGNNGAGKTTLVKIIFQEYGFDSGTIKYFDVDIKNNDYRSWYFFSENNELPKNITVKNYLNIIKNLTSLSKENFKIRTNEINNFINIQSFLKQKIVSLSAGQQKILSLYLCFLLKPKVIFFDEPTANLDIENKNIILKAIKQLKSKDRLIVIITHLIEEVKELLDHVVIIDEGKIKYDEKFSSSKENLKQIFENNVTQKHSNEKEIKIKEYINEK